MIEELAGRVFSTRNAAHLQHWRTKSYAEHVALGDFYDDVIEQIDGLVEQYQGAFGLIGAVKPDTPVDKDIIKALEEDVVFINKNYDKITKGLRSLANTLDGISDLYLTTLYKLKNLS